MGMAVHVGFLFILDVNCQGNLFPCSSFSKQKRGLLLLLDVSVSLVVSKCFSFYQKLSYSTRKLVIEYSKVSENSNISLDLKPRRVTVIIQLIISCKISSCSKGKAVAVTSGVNRLEGFSVKKSLSFGYSCVPVLCGK